MNAPINAFAKFQDSASLSVKKSSQNSSQQHENENEKEMPENEEESKNEKNNSPIKICTNQLKDWVFISQENWCFMTYDSKHHVQFHPEFTTPPPKL